MKKDIHFYGQKILLISFTLANHTESWYVAEYDQADDDSRVVNRKHRDPSGYNGETGLFHIDSPIDDSKITVNESQDLPNYRQD